MFDPSNYYSHNIPNDFDDLSPNSTLLEEEPYISSYYHSPSPLIYNEIIDNLGEFLSHHELAIIQQGGLEDNNSIVLGNSFVFGATNDKGKTDTTNRAIVQQEGVNHGSRRRKHSKTDRHSKIRTAHGLRDRRMRLSLRAARPFFKLQDMLGFDKASKTIEWLLIQSKSSIEERFQSINGISSTSKETYSTISSISDYEVESIVTQEQGLKGKKSKCKKGSTTNKIQREKRSTTKESRNEARDRARKRTLERKLLKNDEKLATWRLGFVDGLLE